MQMKSPYPLPLAMLALFFAILATPLLFSKLPFPSLDQAEHLEGVVEVELHRTMSRDGTGQLASIYVQTAGRRVEVDCGYLFDRRPCPDYELIHGARGEIWYHHIFGILQWRLIKPDTGEVFFVGIDSIRRHREKRGYNDKYVRNLVFALAALAAAAHFVVRK